MSENFIESSFIRKDSTFETNLRPETLSDFVGQNKIKKQLRILIEAAKKRNDPLPHTLFSGPPGLGKTTLANIIAKSMGTKLITTSGPMLEKPGDLAGLLTNLQEGDIFFIDEIHRLPKNVEEYLYPAIEDYKLDLLIDSGPGARSVQIKLNKFTLVGATTRSGLISSPMRSRFSFNTRLDYYDYEDLQQIIKRASIVLKTEITEKAAFEIAKRSRGTPRIANNLLRWVRDYFQTNSSEKSITAEVAIKALELLCIDHVGLDEMDKNILNVIIKHYNGGPVGLQSLAVALGEDSSTIAEVYEPFLIMKGFIKRTLRGREVTKSAYEHLGKKIPQKLTEINS